MTSFRNEDIREKWLKLIQTFKKNVRKMMTLIALKDYLGL